MSTTTSTYLQLDKLDEPPQKKVDSRGNLLLEKPSFNNALPKENGTRSEDFEQEQAREVKQSALLLKGFREEYTLVTDHDVPSILHKGEILIKVAAIGLNPIDWKAP